MMKVQCNSQGKIYVANGKVLLTSDSGGSKYGCTVDNFLGNIDVNGVLQLPNNITGDIIFTDVKDVVAYALYNRFYGNSNLTTLVSFPDLENTSGNNGLYYAFYQTNITAISLPKLKTVTGNNALHAAFCLTKITSLSLPELTTVSGLSGLRQLVQGCSLLETISVPKLQEVSGNYGIASLANSTKITTLSFPMLSNLTGNSACQGLIGMCQYITDMYFPALTTTSFGSNTNQFVNMCDGYTARVSDNVTIHFPSNLQSTISNLTGYPLFGGTSGYVTLAFDLTAIN